MIFFNCRWYSRCKPASVGAFRTGEPTGNCTQCQEPAVAIFTFSSETISRIEERKKNTESTHKAHTHKPSGKSSMQPSSCFSFHPRAMLLKAESIQAVTEKPPPSSEENKLSPTNTIKLRIESKRNETEHKNPEGFCENEFLSERVVRAAIAPEKFPHERANRHKKVFFFLFLLAAVRHSQLVIRCCSSFINFYCSTYSQCRAPRSFLIIIITTMTIIVRFHRHDHYGLMEVLRGRGRVAQRRPGTTFFRSCNPPGYSSIQ